LTHPENYRIIDPNNTDAILIVLRRNMTAQEKIDYVNVRSEVMAEALLITDPDKGKTILRRASHASGLPENALRTLLNGLAEEMQQIIVLRYV
jgi:bifunctional ADP-heptose synthase (sugar kinase/adenylyltransferase)